MRYSKERSGAEMNKKHKFEISKIILHMILIVMSLGFLIPFLYVISISFSDEATVIETGYKLIPPKFSIEAYRYVFANPQKLLWAYRTTIIQAAAATVLSLLLMSMLAYPLSRKEYKYKNALSLFVYFTTLFSGGMVPIYILNTQYLHLDNTIWIYIIPGLVNAFYVIVIRTFFQGLPSSLMESARIDGCHEIRTLFQIVLPLSKPVLATVGLMTLLAHWNVWNTTLLYIRDEELYSLQYLLQRILRDANFISQMAEQMPSGIDLNVKVPSESMRFAMCVVAAGPMLVVFPFFQKYFASGLTVGAVKG